MKLERVLHDELTKLVNMEINERTYLELKLEINKSCPDNYLCADRSKVGDEQKQYVIKNGEKEITLIGEKNFQKYWEHICWKEIASFLNSNGGRLYIGVADNPNPQTGKRDVHGVVFDKVYPFPKDSKTRSLDDITQTINEKLETFFPPLIPEKYLKVMFIPFEDKYVLVIDVKALSFDDWPVMIAPSPEKGKNPRIFVRRKDSSAQTTTDIETIIKLAKAKFAENPFTLPKSTNGWSDEKFRIISFLNRKDPMSGDSPEIIILHDKGVSIDVFSKLDFDDALYGFQRLGSRDQLLKDLSLSIGSEAFISFEKPYEQVLEERLDGRVIAAVEQIVSQKLTYDGVKAYEGNILSASIMRPGALKKIWNIDLLKLITKDGSFYAIPEFFGYFIRHHSFFHHRYFGDPEMIRANAIAKFPNEEITYPEWYGDEKWKFVVGATLTGRVVKFEGIDFITIENILYDEFDYVSNDKSLLN